MTLNRRFFLAFKRARAIFLLISYPAGDKRICPLAEAVFMVTVSFVLVTHLTQTRANAQYDAPPQCIEVYNVNSGISRQQFAQVQELPHPTPVIDLRRVLSNPPACRIADIGGQNAYAYPANWDEDVWIIVFISQNVYYGWDFRFTNARAGRRSY